MVFHYQKVVFKENKWRNKAICFAYKYLKYLKYIYLSSETPLCGKLSLCGKLEITGYVMNFSDTVETSESADIEVNSQTSDQKQEKEVLTSQNQTSGGLKRGSQPFPYYMNKTEMSKTNLSILPSEHKGRIETNTNIVQIYEIP